MQQQYQRRRLLSAKKASSCEGCKELKQKFDFQYAQQQEFIIQLQQSITQQQQTNAQLLSGINSVVFIAYAEDPSPRPAPLSAGDYKLT